jgi:hypothetical protein
MPIRLLSFEKHGPNLDITLLNRTQIYSRLALKLRDRMFGIEFKGSELCQKQVDLAMKWVEELPKTYAILSHTWLRRSPGEVTYDDWYQGTFDSTHPGYRKLANFCRVALEDHGFTLGWMDTVCINKESSAELDESIRSMYKWYQSAEKCIVYLAETTTLANMAKDTWFTRGWTLQELLAPSYIIFYGAEWTALGNGSINDKDDSDILHQIESATNITPAELASPKSQTISCKMQWAAKRNVTRREDAAYSLTGIFDVSISIAYGEGSDLAFTRLIKEILNTAKSDVLELFNWAGFGFRMFNTSASALIPSTPAAYIQSGKFDFGRMSLIEPLAITHLGLRIPVVLIPAVPHRSKTPYTPMGNYYSTVDIKTHPLRKPAKLGKFWNIVETPRFESRFFSHEGAPLGLAFAVLNCGGSNDSDILLFKHCFAIAILYSHNNGIATPLGYKLKVPTLDPISFELENRSRSSHDDWEYDSVSKGELARHGMQFLTMYL